MAAKVKNHSSTIECGNKSEQHFIKNIKPPHMMNWSPSEVIKSTLQKVKLLHLLLQITVLLSDLVKCVIEQEVMSQHCKHAAMQHCCCSRFLPWYDFTNLVSDILFRRMFGM
jgi:hypothetical protein